MNVFTNKLFIEFDENENVLRIFNPTQRVSGEQMRIAEISLATLESLGFEKGAEFIGERIVLVIPKLREVLWESSQEGQKVMAEVDNRSASLKVAASAGDAAAQFDLAIYYFEKAKQEHSWCDVEIAEDWLTKSATNGFAEAQRYLDGDWKLVKEVLKRQLPGTSDPKSS